MTPISAREEGLFSLARMGIIVGLLDLFKKIFVLQMRTWRSLEVKKVGQGPIAAELGFELLSPDS